jgi:hypothetical protein
LRAKFQGTSSNDFPDFSRNWRFLENGEENKKSFERGLRWMFLAIPKCGKIEKPKLTNQIRNLRLKIS